MPGLVNKGAFRSEGMGDSVVLSDVVALCYVCIAAVARRVPPLWVLKALVTGKGITGGRCSDPSRQGISVGGGDSGLTWGLFV